MFFDYFNEDTGGSSQYMYMRRRSRKLRHYRTKDQEKMELMKVGQIQNLAEDKSTVDGLSARGPCPGQKRRCGKGAAGTMKVVVRKHELERALELIMRSGGASRGSTRAPAARGDTEHGRLPAPGLSAEQRLSMLRRRKFSSKCGRTVRDFGGRGSCRSHFCWILFIYGRRIIIDVASN